MRPAWLYRSGLGLVDRSRAFSWRHSLCPPCSVAMVVSHKEHGCADVKSMARNGVKCRHPAPSLTRVIVGRRIGEDRGVGSVSVAFPNLCIGRQGIHPDELPRRVMITHPAAVDAGPRTARGGSVKAMKYRTCDHGFIRGRELRSGFGKPRCAAILFATAGA